MKSSAELNSSGQDAGWCVLDGCRIAPSASVVKDPEEGWGGYSLAEA